MIDVPELIRRYCEAWTDSDPNRRADLLRSVWAAGATYTDPGVHIVGADKLLAHIAGIQERRPGAAVALTTVIDFHHDVVRFGWRIVSPHGSTLREGIDVVVLEDSRLIERVIGFYDT